MLNTRSSEECGGLPIVDPTDAELVAGVRAGSRDAAAELARRYLRGARAIALAIIRDVSAAEDVAQDAFVYAIEKIGDCRSPDRFAAWFTAIVRSHAHNHLRDPRVSRAADLREGALVSATTPPDRDAIRSEARDRLLRALGELTESRRTILLLHDLEGWTHGEIAHHLKMPAGTVRSHLHHARKRMRELLPELSELSE